MTANAVTVGGRELWEPAAARVLTAGCRVLCPTACDSGLTVITVPLITPTNSDGTHTSSPCSPLFCSLNGSSAELTVVHQSCCPWVKISQRPPAVAAGKANAASFADILILGQGRGSSIDDTIRRKKRK